MQDRLITGEKTPEQIQAMRDGGKKLAQIFQDIREENIFFWEPT